jgi:pyruvate/2-oxoglutarate dehydrogenase complex dihydrolipoamide dehydrogenase (E3) component
MKDRNGTFKSVLFDVLLIATGKTPNISELNLELAEIDHSVDDGI